MKGMIILNVIGIGSPRLHYICGDLKKVFSKSIYELNDIYYSMEEKVVHNFQHFLSYVRQRLMNLKII